MEFWKQNHHINRACGNVQGDRQSHKNIGALAPWDRASSQDSRAADLSFQSGSDLESEPSRRFSSCRNQPPLLLLGDAIPFSPNVPLRPSSGVFLPAAPRSPSNDSQGGFLSHWFQLNPPGLSPSVAISPAPGFGAKCVGIPRGPAEERDSRGPPACSTRSCTAPSLLLVRLFYKSLF